MPKRKIWKKKVSGFTALILAVIMICSSTVYAAEGTEAEAFPEGTEISAEVEADPAAAVESDTAGSEQTDETTAEASDLMTDVSSETEEDVSDEAAEDGSAEVPEEESADVSEEVPADVPEDGFAETPEDKSAEAPADEAADTETAEPETAAPKRSRQNRLKANLSSKPRKTPASTRSQSFLSLPFRTITLLDWRDIQLPSFRSRPNMTGQPMSRTNRSYSPVLMNL